MGGSVRNSEDRDIQYILRWLREDKSGFYGNGNLIQRAHEQGRLIVVARPKGDVAIAFNVGGLREPGLFAVKSDHQRKGIGRQLVIHLVEKAVKDDICGLYIHCKPSSSIPFWKAMGFQTVAQRVLGRPTEAYRVLPKVLDWNNALPSERLGINIHTYDQSIPPIFCADIDVQPSGKELQLRERFCIFLENGHDHYVTLTLGNRVIWEHKKLKYSRDIGFRQPQCSLFWYLDALSLS